MVSKKDKKLSIVIKKKRQALYQKMAETGCIACRDSGEKQTTPTEIHHLRQGMGMSQRNVKCIPLCVDHHRGNKGYHGMGRRSFEARYGTEEYLLSTWEEMYESIDWEEYY
tara:strand:- start:1464 stop:1796 length:333 start_codon:yes stop_codon:yes gene_type:complete